MNAKDMTVYDYTNQAWIVNGVYARCGHPEAMNCGCFGRLHAGETPDLANCDVSEVRS